MTLSVALASAIGSPNAPRSLESHCIGALACPRAFEQLSCPTRRVRVELVMHTQWKTVSQLAGLPSSATCVYYVGLASDVGGGMLDHGTLASLVDPFVRAARRAVGGRP